MKDMNESTVSFEMAQRVLDRSGIHRLRVSAWEKVTPYDLYTQARVEVKNLAGWSALTDLIEWTRERMFEEDYDAVASLEGLQMKKPEEWTSYLDAFAARVATFNINLQECIEKKRGNDE